MIRGVSPKGPCHPDKTAAPSRSVSGNEATRIAQPPCGESGLSAVIAYRVESAVQTISSAPSPSRSILFSDSRARREVSKNKGHPGRARGFPSRTLIVVWSESRRSIDTPVSLPFVLAGRGCLGRSELKPPR
jgi:hypothetical protein